MDKDAQDNDFNLLKRGDASYPKQLLEISDPPPLLYLRGDARHAQARQVAVVGSRNATHDGKRIARDFAAQLAVQGYVVTSGLALGIDSAAHAGALDAGGYSVAALGSGIDVEYPKQNAGLMRRIAGQGALITEYAPGTPPRRQNFPSRNRIISGLAEGVLVVEAGLRSGSLITARLALEQGREVFAVPGSTRNPLARGCHALIKQGAKLVERIEDVLEELPPVLHTRALETPTASEPEGDPPAELLDSQLRLLLQAVGFDPTPLDLVTARSKLSPEKIGAAMVELELAGHVRRIPGGYQRTAR